MRLLSRAVLVLCSTSILVAPARARRDHVLTAGVDVGHRAVFAVGDLDSSLIAPRWLPDHVHVSRDGADLVLDMRWSIPSSTVLFFMFWCGFAAVLYIWQLRSPSPERIRRSSPWTLVGVVLFMLYCTTAGYVNHTWIRVGSGLLEVKVGPMPWPGSRRLDAGTISQVFSEKYLAGSGPTLHANYRVTAITREGSKIPLVSGLTDPYTARFFEWEIERALRIPDRDVPGELPR